MVTAPGSGAEVIPFLKTWVNLPMAIGFTVLYAKVRQRTCAAVHAWHACRCLCYTATALFICPDVCEEVRQGTGCCSFALVQHLILNADVGAWRSWQTSSLRSSCFTPASYPSSSSSARLRLCCTRCATPSTRTVSVQGAASASACCGRPEQRA